MDIEEEIRSLQLDSADSREEIRKQSDKSVVVEHKGKEKETPDPEEEHDDMELDKKRHLNVVFIGHVDAGKSTTGGQILFLSGQVDDRTIQKYEKEAKDKSRESWYMAYIMDTNEEERVKGKTVEVGRAHFETETSRFTILDAPGHKSYVPNMISGASQADIGVLVISARKGEFETGYERGGQTREHVQLAKTLGVSKMLVVVNKMDEPTVNWSKERYDEIVTKMIPFLKASGYNVKKDVQFLPISGLMGTNMKTRLDKSVCSWWDGPCLFEALDSIEVPLRDPKGPFRMPIIDKFKDMGTVVMGKVESGSVREGDSLFVMPNKVPVKAVAIYIDEDRVKRAGPGENLRVRLSGIDDEDILSGFVVSSVAKPIPAVTEFFAQLQILELLDNAILTAGYKAVLHIHSIVEECEIIELVSQIDTKTKKPMKKHIRFVKNGAIVVCKIQVSNTICIEKFADFPQLGRFTLRTEGKTIAVGKVIDQPSNYRNNSSA
nr:eukaryotic peptide chain release factor GTP-binding subunit ERF3A-like isoform X3 [Malus domestica]